MTISQITNEEFLKTIGMEFKVARIRKNWSRPQLKEKSGLSIACIKQIEDGEVDAHILNYKRLFDALDMDMKVFL